MKQLIIIIITGLSGSGKSTAMAAFEDAGYYCVDNMPVALLPKFLELPIESDTGIAGIALAMDLREKKFLSEYSGVFESLKKEGYTFEILFLEADEDILVQRYSATRRQHPLSQQGKSLLEGIRAEKKQLADLRAVSDKIIDTSKYTVHELKTSIMEIARKTKGKVSMRIQVVSFGFKYGVPHDADLIIDVRFLANPYFVSDLKPLDGNHPKIKKFVLSHQETQAFLNKYLDLIDYLIPLYEKEGKAYLTIGVGCTGGRHRSVTIAGAIFDHLRKTKDQIEIVHRDIHQSA
ncbi:MAG: RNase adapter RapZ [Deltaproteobacteria bacterium]|nr:RNase adapter RapZ [Deltaproteobacteria bacterium]